MKKHTKGLLLGTLVGIGTGVLINKLLSEKSLSEIKDTVTNNIDKTTHVVKENVNTVLESMKNKNNDKPKTESYIETEI